MRDYIKRLARGQYTYKQPELTVSDGNIDMTIVAGEITEHNFVISFTESVKDIIFSSNPKIKLLDSEFAGKEQTIRYQIDARDEKSGNLLEGCFHVVSSAGEKDISYVFHVTEPYFETSLGKAYNLFHFTNLVHVAPDEAAGIFRSKRFVEIFIREDQHLKNTYEALIRQNNVYVAMEEFLLVLRKKTQIVLEIDESRRVFEDFCDNVKERIAIHKSTWGHIELEVCSDAPFIQLDVNRIHSDDFTGGKYELEYLLNHKDMHAGINYGRIYIKNFHQQFVIEIEVHHTGYKPADMDSLVFLDHGIERKRAKKGLVTEYLNYRMKKQDMTSWIQKSNQILDRIRGIVSQDDFFDLAQAQMYLMEKREEDGRWLLDHVKMHIFTNVEQHVELYCYYLYVNSLLEHSPDYTREAIETITRYYENGYDSWQLLWILFYLKGGQENNQSVKLIRIKDAFHNGCTSPIMYFEACNILNQQPQLLRVMNQFEIKIITFGCRYGIIQEKLAVQVGDVIGNEKLASPVCMELLKQLYKMYEDDRILTALVTHMVRNAYTGKNSFDYYEKGVLRGLRITRLYEYYLASILRSYDKRIPKVVLMYFEYDNELEYHLKAYLYANILKNKDSYGDIYESYEKNMEIFVYEQLKQGHVDDSLVILYRALWKEQLIDSDTVDFMAKLLFMHQFTCFDQGVSAVSVKHKEQKEPIVYPLEEGKTYAPMYTEGCSVVFVCEDGTVRKDSVNYEMEKVFADMPLKDKILFENSENEGVNLYFSTSYANRGQYTSNAVLSWFHMLDNALMNKEFHYTVNGWIIHYYYEYYTGDDFRSILGLIIKDELDTRTAKELMESCINFNLCGEAFDLIEQYGYECIAPARLFRLMKYMIGVQGDEYQSLLVEIGGFIFHHRVYDEDILNYMMNYYSSTNEELYQMWKAALNFSMNVESFSERVLAQFLFTGEHTGRMTEIFTYYYERGARGMVVSAYISYNAYLYLIHQKKANEIVFTAIEQAFEDNRELPDTCYIAWLKHMTEINVEQFTEERQLKAQKILNILCRDNKLYAFYNKFKGILDVPYNAVDKTVIEFRANPDSKVEIHYTYDNDERSEYVTEIMKVSAGGLFTRAFTLLYGDKITYYFTVTGGGANDTSDKFSYESGELSSDMSQTRYDYMNDCLASRELHDMVTMKKMMRSYSVMDYVTKQMFKPMKG